MEPRHRCAINAAVEALYDQRSFLVDEHFQRQALSGTGTITREVHGIRVTD